MSMPCLTPIISMPCVIKKGLGVKCEVKSQGLRLFRFFLGRKEFHKCMDWVVKLTVHEGLLIGIGDGGGSHLNHSESPP